MRLLGEIIRLQVQTTSLKVGDRPPRSYDPAGIQAVPSLTIDSGGVCGVAADGARIDDVHHADHPRSKSRGTNAVSVLFTAHYDEMRRRFGGWLADGIAGENILLQCDRHVSEEHLQGGIQVQMRGGGAVDLSQVIVAEPCVEFARFALRFPHDQRPDRTVTDAVSYLSDGMRGYYAVLQGVSTTISLGDRVYALDRSTA